MNFISKFHTYLFLFFYISVFFFFSVLTFFSQYTYFIADLDFKNLRLEKKEKILFLDTYISKKRSLMSLEELQRLYQKKNNTTPLELNKVIYSLLLKKI